MTLDSDFAFLGAALAFALAFLWYFPRLLRSEYERGRLQGRHEIITGFQRLEGRRHGTGE